MISTINVAAAEFRLNINDTFRSLDIEGLIVPGDYDRFLKFVKENQAQLSDVRLYCPGGNFEEAIKIGRALRALELSSTVPMVDENGNPVCFPLLGSQPRKKENCIAAGAAFFIHIGGIYRGGTYLLVNRPKFDPAEFATLSQSEAKDEYDILLANARSYMTAMEVPPEIQSIVLNTPSDNAVLLDEKLTRTHIWGDPAYRHEWLRAKCGKLTEEQSQRLKKLGLELSAGRKLTGEESTDLGELQPIQEEEIDCKVKLTEQSQRRAFEKFFGKAPSDTEGYNFSKWAEAPKYIGRLLEDVVSEERFEPSTLKTEAMTYDRKETANSPAASVTDGGITAGVVSAVFVTKASPSIEFLKAVDSTLASAWGNPVIVNDVKVWKAKYFTARLEYMSKGHWPGLTLIVDRQK